MGGRRGLRTGSEPGEVGSAAGSLGETAPSDPGWTRGEARGGAGQSGGLEQREGPGRGGGVSGRGPGTWPSWGRGPGRGGAWTFAPRPQVSQAAAELLAFCETHAKDDPLVTPVPAAENPFRDKRLFCVLL